jgi:4-oxalocrotonate tautomerase
LWIAGYGYPEATIHNDVMGRKGACYCEHSEAVMPLIRVAMFPGRTAEQKQALVEEMTEAFLRTCGGSREGVWVIIDEVPREHWAIGGELRG